MKKEEKGITLIALVVTIVVLLILAGVSISMLTGENGIINQAMKAKEENAKAELQELVDLAITEWQTRDASGESVALLEVLEDKRGKEFDSVTLEENNQIKIIKDANEIIVDVNEYLSEEKVLALMKGKYYEKDTTLTIAGTKVTIPGGATVSGINSEIKSINNGIVIYITNGEEITNWEADTNSNGIKDVQEKYDQFVWVPVKNAVLDLSSNLTALASDDSIKAAVQNEIDAGRYPMAIKKNQTDYFGVLYGFEEEGGAIKVSPLTDWTPTGTTGKREPAYLTDSTNGDASSNNNTNPQISESLLQVEFNTMVKSINKKGGFWVGRYETSNMIKDNTKDITNKVTVIRGTTTGINNISLYRMYAQQKNYSKLKLQETTTSSMIWGNQWDQIMLWMKDVENTINTTNGKYYVTNGVGMGNYVEGDSDTSTSIAVATGNRENYKVKNIYDLAGNLREWTLEANSTNNRVLRGSYYNIFNSIFSRPDSRVGYVPETTYPYFGSRLTLY